MPVPKEIVDMKQNCTNRDYVLEAVSMQRRFT